jgi:hypothetical protein
MPWHQNSLARARLHGRGWQEYRDNLIDMAGPPVEGKRVDWGVVKEHSGQCKPVCDADSLARDEIRFV